MKKLCFGTLATVLVKCSAKTTTKKQLVGTILLSVNSSYDIRGEDWNTSALISGRVNLSDEVIVYARDVDPHAVSSYFKEKVLPLLDLNYGSIIVLALKDIIANDPDIVDSREIEMVNKQTKANS